ncbi:PAS domain S-box protein [Leptospira kirschneri serovar Mozdok]|nr:PAS domain S-box protein [Leptospira kirschneri serovar Mozdok]
MNLPPLHENMGLVWSTFAFYSGFSFIVFGINSLIAYKNRRIQGSKEFLLVVTGLALYSFGSFFEIISRNEKWILFWDDFQFIGRDVTIIGISFLILRLTFVYRLYMVFFYSTISDFERTSHMVRI